MRVRGHAGINRVRFRGRVKGATLATGVYYVTATVVRGNDRRVLGRLSLAIVRRQGHSVLTPAPSAAQPCRLAAVATALRRLGHLLSSASRATVPAPARQSVHPGSGSNGSLFGGLGAVKGAIHTLRGTPVVAAVEAAPYKPWFSPLLIAGFVLSTLLVLTAALPRRLAVLPTLVANRRSESAYLGVTLLLAMLVALLLTRV
jgi:hypothetical protein